MTGWGVLGTAVVMFAATNVDDALLLVVFFASAAEGKDGMRRRHVLLGQALGFTLIVVASLAGTAVGSFLPAHYTGLLGFIPMLMGFWRMRAWCANGQDEDMERDAEAGLESSGKGEPSAEYQDVKTPRSQASPTAIAGAAALDRASVVELQQRQDTIPSNDPGKSESESGKVSQRLAAVFNIHTLKIIGVTVANSGDNVAIYIPVLITYDISEILLTTAVFYAMLVLWLYVISTFVSFRFVAVAINKYGDYVIPVALILLGVYILWSADTIKLVCSSC